MKMKRLLALIFIITMLLASCGMIEEKASEAAGEIMIGVIEADMPKSDYGYVEHEKAFRKIMDKVLAAFDKGDKEGLKSLFAAKAIEKDPDLDAQIEAFFEVYCGPMEIVQNEDSGHKDSIKRYGMRFTKFSNAPDTIIVAGGVRYYLAMYVYLRDDFDKGNKGIHVLSIATELAYSSEYFCHYREGDTPGLYFQDSAEKRDDIKWIEGDFYKYTPYERDLTAENLKAIVERDDSYYWLVSDIGEPNCSWHNMRHYFELENGLFAACVLDVYDRHGSGTTNSIIAIYLASEGKSRERETIWMADGIAKVGGEYIDFQPIDRELTEDFFVSFFERSNSPEKLLAEIGPPNCKRSFSDYYQLTDGRYVECSTDWVETPDGEANYVVVDGVYIADEDGRLYTIWERE